MTPTLPGLLAEPIPDEPTHGHLLPDLGRHLVEELLDRLRVVLHVRLVEQDRLCVERLQLALHDLRDHVVGLAHLPGLRLEDASLGRELFRGDLVAGDVPRRRGARDMERQVPGEPLELVRVGDEVRLAVDLHHRTDRVVEVDVGLDEPLVRRTTRAAGRRREPPRPQDLLRLVEIAVRLLKRLLALHHAGAGSITEFLHQPRVDLRHRLQPASVESASGAGSGTIGSGPAAASGAAAASAAGAGSAAGRVRGAGTGSGAGAGAAVGFGAAAGSGSISGPVARVTTASRPACRPSARASAIRRVTSETDRIASSLPGITKSTSSGSQFVSTIAITEMPSLRASLTAMCSFFVSITKIASGSRSRLCMPPRLRSSLSFSCRRRIASRLGRKSNAPVRSISRSSRRRSRRRETVWKFVSIPPSQRVVTDGIATRAACSEMTSCACFFVPTNRITPPRRPRSLA